MLGSVGMAIRPLKADAPVVVDADTSLSHAIPLPFLQSGSGQGPPCSHVRRRVENVQFAERLPLDGLEPANNSRWSSRLVSGQRKERITAQDDTAGH